jgi:hypothetical protein
VIARIFRRLLVVIGVVGASACTSSGRDSGPIATSVDSSRGYRILSHSGTPQRWRADLVATVGADTGGPYEFGAVTSIVLGSTGRLHVLDGGQRQLIVFDSLGSLLGRWGRRGKGPGEYTAPNAIAMLHDSVALLDRPGSGRIMIFGPDGAWVRDWRVNAPTGANDLILYRTGADMFWTQTAFVGDGGIRRAYLRQPPRDASDTVDVRTAQVPGLLVISCAAGGGAFSFYPAPFGPVAITRPFRSGNQAVAVSSDYRLWIIAPSGDTLLGIERVKPPATLTDAEWDAEVQKFQAWRASRGNPACTRSGFERPAVRPVVQRMFVDDEGLLWVETYGGAEGVYEVFGEDGSLRATVGGLPPSGGVDPSVVAGRIALYAPDSNDVPRVRVYRLRKP